MASWDEALTHFGLERVGKKVRRLSRNSIRLSATDQTEAATHRLGGRPNLPPSYIWPAQQEMPLAFLAQLDLAALPAADGIDLPRSGALHFFWGGMDTGCGFSQEDRGSWQVTYTEGALGEFPRRALPEELEEELRFGPVRLTVEGIEPTLPGGEDMNVEALGLTSAEREGYEGLKALWDENRPKPAHPLSGYPSWCNSPEFRKNFDLDRPFGLHRVGGFPDYIQHDPKLEAHLVNHGLYCGDSTGYDEGRKRGLFPGAADWELLLQLDSEEGADVSLGGDVGRVHFLIHKDDLRDCRFERT
jgi:uncharacterized protein YwqG